MVANSLKCHVQHAVAAMDLKQHRLFHPSGRFQQTAMCAGGVVTAAENVVILLLLCVRVLQYRSTSFEPVNMNFSKHKSKKDRLVCQLLLCSCHEPH